MAVEPVPVCHAGGRGFESTIRPDGSGQKDLTGLTGGTENAFAGSFSPDGQQIVFRVEPGDSSSLAVIDRDGRNVHA